MDNVSVYQFDQNSLRIIGLKTGAVKIALYDLQGRLVLDGSFNSEGVLLDVPLPNIVTGVYVFKLVNSSGQNSSNKILIK